MTNKKQEQSQDHDQKQAEPQVEIKLVSYFDDRFYKIERVIDGEANTVYYPSVTTKLGIMPPTFVARWRGDIGNREADARLFESQERGKRIHRALEVMLGGGQIIYSNWQNPVTAEELEAINIATKGNFYTIKYQDEMMDVWKLQRFLELVNPRPLRSEFTVFDDEFKEAGTLDALFYIKGGSYAINGRTPIEIEEGIYVNDLKSGKNVEAKAKYQTAAYGKMVEKMFGIQVMGTMILHTQAKTLAGIPGFSVKITGREEMELDYVTYRNIAAVWERENKDVQPKIFDFPQTLQYDYKEPEKKETKNEWIQRT